jgi:hypothetical protein
MTSSLSSAIAMGKYLLTGNPLGFSDEIISVCRIARKVLL